MIVFYGLVKLKKKAFYTLIGLAHFTHFNVQLLILVLYTIVYVRAASRKFRVYTRHNAQKQEQVNTIVRLVMRSEMQPKLIVWWCQNERQRHTQEMPTTFLIHFNRYYSYARWIQWCQFFFRSTRLSCAAAVFVVASIYAVFCEYKSMLIYGCSNTYKYAICSYMYIHSFFKHLFLFTVFTVDRVFFSIFFSSAFNRFSSSMCCFHLLSTDITWDCFRFTQHMVLFLVQYM